MEKIRMLRIEWNDGEIDMLRGVVSYSLKNDSVKIYYADNTNEIIDSNYVYKINFVNVEKDLFEEIKEGVK